MERHPLHDKYPELHKSKEVEHEVDRRQRHGEKLPNEPGPKLESWMSTLEKIHIGRDPKTTQRIKDSYHRQHCLSPDEPMPNGFFSLQARIALDEGRVEVEGETHKDRIKNLSDQFKQRYEHDDDFRSQVELTKTDYIQKQHDSLDKWIDYLSDPETLYPMWFKYYVFRNIAKMGGYDKQNHSFRKRTAHTTDPFPHLDSEALAQVLGVLRDHYDIADNNPEGEPLELDAKTKQLLDQDASFAKLYAHTLEHLSPISEEALAVTKGRWVKYPAGSSGAELSAGVRSSVTGWCVSDPGTAGNYLARGDFWVYYTPNPEGGEIARIAIATNGDTIGEVRGIVSSADGSQHLEGSMTTVAQEKLQQLPGGAEFIKPASDMQRLTEIYDYLIGIGSMHAPLTDEQLSFLYELESNIESLGYGRDPRIEEIRNARSGTDTERLKPLLLEAIRSQAEFSLTAANTMIEQLNAMRSPEQQIPLVTPEQFEQILEAKYQEWQENGSLDYILDRFEKHGGRFTLVATPNILATPDEIMDLARKFGEDQPQETYVDKDLYDQYSAEELSGKLTPDSTLRLSLIPNQYDERLYGNVDRQRDILAEMQKAHPNLAVPSALEAISLWQALRASGDSLDYGATYERTWIKHFDLEPALFEGYRDVPFSYVSSDGGPDLFFSNADSVNYARLSVR